MGECHVLCHTDRTRWYHCRIERKRQFFVIFSPQACSTQRIKTKLEISPVSLGTEGKRGEEEGKGGIEPTGCVVAAALALCHSYRLPSRPFGIPQTRPGVPYLAFLYHRQHARGIVKLLARIWRACIFLSFFLFLLFNFSSGSEMEKRSSFGYH